MAESVTVWSIPVLHHVACCPGITCWSNTHLLPLRSLTVHQTLWFSEMWYLKSELVKRIGHYKAHLYGQRFRLSCHLEQLLLQCLQVRRHYIAHQSYEIPHGLKGKKQQCYHLNEQCTSHDAVKPMIEDKV